MEFQVKLEGIKLSKDAQKRIQTGIQELVIRELADFDAKGDLLLKRPIKLGPILNGIVARLDRGNINITGLP